MERCVLILLLASSMDFLFIRSSCERPSLVGGDPRTAHLGVAKAGEPVTQMDKYFAKWQPGQNPTQQDSNGVDGDAVHDAPDPNDSIEPSGPGQTQSEDDILKEDDVISTKEIPMQLDSDAILKELGHSYDPLGGKMDVLLKQVKISDGETHRNSKYWVDRSHQAIKAAHHLIAESSNDAQSELMKDGLRMDEAIRGNWKNETAKMYALSLDPSLHSRIHLEVNTRRKLTPRQRENGEDERIIVPPPAKPDELIGKRVLCNNYYEGENPDIVRGHYGVVTAYDPHVLKYRVRLKHWMGKDFMPLLKHEEFELAGGEELDGVDVAATRPATERTSWAAAFPGEAVGGEDQAEDSPEYLAAMDTYREKPVLVHHLPKHLLEQSGFDKDQYLNNLGTIVDYRHTADSPEFRVKMDKEDKDLRASLQQEQRPWLTLDRDFNFVEELKGKEVQVVLPDDGEKGTTSYKTPIQDRGMVSEWHPEDGGYYDVSVAEHEEKVKPSQIEHLDGLGYIPPSDEEARKRMTSRKLATTAKFGAGFHDAKFEAGGKKIKTEAS